MIAQDGRSLTGSLTFGEDHQAGPGLVHGGLVAAALDEATGLLVTHFRFPSVTARLTVRYRQPVPINRQLALVARVSHERGRYTEVVGELSESGERLAEATGLFLHVPLEHFLITPEGRSAGAAWQERLSSGGHKH